MKPEEIDRKINPDPTDSSESLSYRQRTDSMATRAETKELNTEELIAHMRCKYANIEEAVEMYNLDIEECRST